MAATVASRSFVKPIAPTVAEEPRILALAFDSQQLAHQALQAAMGLRDDEVLDLHDAVHRSGLHHQRAGLGMLQLGAVQDIEADIFARRWHESSRHALKL